MVDKFTKPSQGGQSPDYIRLVLLAKAYEIQGPKALPVFTPSELTTDSFQSSSDNMTT